MGASVWHHLDVERIIGETERAFCLLLPGGAKVWVPRVVVADADDYQKGDRNCTVSVKEWFAIREGLLRGENVR